MPSPFPGMDPYLETPDLWSGFHSPFIVTLWDHLGPLVAPKYFARVEERVYVAEDPADGRRVVPDVRIIPVARPRGRAVEPAGGGLAIAEPIRVVERREEQVREYRLVIRDRLDRSVVTVIELPSPTNKTPGSRGRASYLQKRREVYETDAHWMEIDLLRGGTRAAASTPEAGTPYQVYLSRVADGDRVGFVWPVALADRLPVVGVPLRGDDPDVPLDLQSAFDHVYDRNAYADDLATDYAADPPLPAMSGQDSAWCRAIVAGRPSPA